MSVITWETGVVAVPGRSTGGRPVPATARRATAARSARAHTQSPPTGLRLTRRGRLVVAVLALLVAGGVTFSTQNATAGSGQEASEVVTYTVAAGDTLWAIAGSVAEPGQDRREVVDRIIEINGLAGGDLRAGQLLIVPAP